MPKSTGSIHLVIITKNLSFASHLRPAPSLRPRPEALKMPEPLTLTANNHRVAEGLTLRWRDSANAAHSHKTNKTTYVAVYLIHVCIVYISC